MQKRKNIKALFFLGVFSMLLIHQIVPHLHHQHQDTHQHDVAHNHNEHHDHNHHHEHEEDSSQKGFIDWFLETHAHTNTAVNVLVLEQTTFKEIVVKKEIVKTIFPKTVSLVSYDTDLIRKNWYQPPDKLQNSYIPNLALRGPPNLG